MKTRISFLKIAKNIFLNSARLFKHFGQTFSEFWAYGCGITQISQIQFENWKEQVHIWR